MRRALVVLVALTALAGCLDLTAARVPDRLLEGSGGNGWARNASASQKAPVGGSTEKTQTLVYEDAHPSPGYPGTLTVTTLRTLLSPSRDKVIDIVQQRIHDDATAKGITLQGDATRGTRTLANKGESSFFVYRGNVSTQGFFSRDAQVKIFGEAWQCPGGKTVVATVGLAQVTDVKSVGGVILPGDTVDETTWSEMVADPRGSIDGQRGSDGLAYNVEC